MTKLRLLHFTR